jgi:hypothetical protein
MKSSFSYKAKFLLLFFFTVSFFSPLCAIAATTWEVQVLDPRSFSPNNLTIEVGDSVRWVNAAGGSAHDVIADDFSFASPTASSFTFTKTFNSIEEILYHCSVHSRPASSGGSAQNGRINVIAAAATTDVSIESVDAIGSDHEAGEDFRVKATLKNNSGEDSGMFNVDFYASVDSNITTGDTLLGTKNITNISAGESENIDESVDLPESLAAGDYFIGAIIDLDDTNLNNNTGVDTTTIYVFTVFIMNAGLNDAWFNPLTDGQGFFITIFPDLGVVSMAWFTYDTELPPMDATANLGDPGHRWITGAGVFVEGQAVMDVVLTSDGIFDTATDVKRTDPPGSDGTLTLTFENCNSGFVDYDITSIDAQGRVPIKRVVIDNVALCVALLRESQ